ncbi:MAG: glycoside hydrolase family 31 protein [Candidatus Brocadiia bacterium]
MSKNIADLLTDDSRIFHREGCEYDWVQKVLGVECDDNVLTARLRLESGKQLKLSVQAVAEGVFRVRAWRGRVKFMDTSPMLAVEELSARPAEYAEQEGCWTLTSGDHGVRITDDPFSVQLLDGDDVLWRLEAEDRAAGALVAPHLGFRIRDEKAEPFLSWRIENEERLFGMGEKFNKVEKTGTRATIWTADTCGLNTTDLSYMAVPVLFSTKGWGMMLHSSFRNFWEIGSFSYTAGSVLTEDDKLDLFLFAGGSLKHLLERYTELSGRPPVPPKWAMGVWLSRCQYNSREEAETAAAGMRERDIPCDVVHLDPPWMKVHYYPIIGVDACDFDWNEEAFPNREEMFASFAEDGLNVCLWINPYLPEGTDIYEEAKAKGYLAETPSGQPARNEHGQPVGITDFTNPEAKEWWKDHLKELLRAGASVFKPDYGERVPEDCVFHNGKTGAEMHNLYLFLYNQAVFEATVEETGEPIIWGRSGYIGSQRYPGTWAGDTQVSWRAMKCCLRGGLSAGMTGISLWSHDIGGFTGPKPDPELYIRWAQWGLLSPLSRFHGTTPREPWEYGDEAVRVVRRYARLRYALIPYLLAAAEESARSGVPIMRHMALEFPHEPNAHTLDDQYMLGPDLLVAPVLIEGARSRPVYLPEGTWTELERPSVTYQGGRFVEMRAPLGRIPVLVREGAVVPKLSGDPQHLKSGPARRIEVDVYPGPRGKSVTFKDEGVRVRLTGRSRDGDVGLKFKAVPMSIRARFLRVRADAVKAGKLETDWDVTESGTEVKFDAAAGGEVSLVVE